MIPIPPTSLRQPAAYANPAIRGKLRHWKERLARQYRVMERAFGNDAQLRPIVEDMTKRGSPHGRRRAFDKIVRALGPGVMLEGLRLDGDYPLALWSILKPRESVAVDAPVESGLAQHCVTVNYVLAGRLPHVLFGISEGIWSLEVPDHALGRAIERSGLLPDALIAEAHPISCDCGRTPSFRPGASTSSAGFWSRPAPAGSSASFASGPMSRVAMP
jgi:hypothetical protein